MPRADKKAKIERDAEEREAGNQQPCYGPRFERKLEAVCKRANRSLSGAHIRAHRHVHADESGRAGEHRTDQESERHQPTQEIGKDQKYHEPDQADRRVLPLQIGLGAFTHGRRDFLHARTAGIGCHDSTRRPHRVNDRERAA